MNGSETRDAQGLARENQSLREQHRVVGEVLRAVARSEGLQAVLDSVIEGAARLCGGEYAALYLTDGDLLRAFSYFIAEESRTLVAVGAREQWEFDRRSPHVRDRTTIAGRVAVTGDVVLIPDLLADPEYSFPLAGGSRTGLGAPVFVDDELIGAIVIVRSPDRPFAKDDVDLVRTFADQSAVAITNARLIEAVERRLQQQRAIGEVLRVIALSERLQNVLDEVVEAARRLSGGVSAQLYLLEDDLLCVFSHSEGELPEAFDYAERHPHKIDRTTVVGRVALSSNVVQIPDVSADRDYSYSLPEHIRALLGVPIVHEGELIGALAIARSEPGTFPDEHVHLVKTFADQSAIAITNARLIEAVERQRTELSRFVSPQVAKLVSSDEGKKLLAGHRAYISCLFCDLRGFTAFAETAAPEELFEVLRQYHNALGELVAQYEGTLEHFAGDGVMVFFNDPVPVEEHELKAIRFALAAQECFHPLAQAWRKRGIELGLGIGISAGYATLGRIGFEGRYDYGALGPDTNLASRLSAEAEPGQTLISQRVHAAVEDKVEAKPVGELELKGFGRPVVAYEVRG